jgi:predicted permease
VLDRLAALPGVRAASLSSFGLLSDDGWGQRIAIPGYTPPRDETMRVNGQIVGPRFFETMGTPIVGGRDFTEEDAQRRDRARGVAIVNEAMAHRFFAGRNAIGLRFGTPAGDSLEIVGVVKDITYRTLRDAAPPTFYVPVFQATINAGTTFIVRTAAGADNAADTLRRAIRDVDPAVLVHAVRPLNELVSASVARERFVAQFATAFGLFALALASTGLYGLISYSVARRRSDIAIRMALGAARPHVIWMVLREDVGLLAAGFVVGLPAAIAAAKLIEGLLFGVTATDPTTIAIAIAVMTAVGLIAGYLPARRASRLDPLSALRCD